MLILFPPILSQKENVIYFETNRSFKAVKFKLTPVEDLIVKKKILTHQKESLKIKIEELKTHLFELAFPKLKLEICTDANCS